MKPLAQNTLLQNRYLIVQLIGKGGMGEVYLAIDQRLGSAVALKRTFYAEDDQLGNAFEREARTLARLRHPVLPKVSDHFIENSNQFLAMEHISGDDLAARLKATQKPFPLSWVLFWADQLLEGLVYLHSHEPPIIHRDIKPQNLKLTDENNIILLDFGLSKNTVGQISETGNTDSVVGYTPHYAPLEQIRGTGTNPRSDLFALSATLYQLLTNIVPPDSLSRADALLGGSPDPIQPISDINGEVPPAISDMILKGMSISQEQRFQSAREMQKALREGFSKMQSAVAAQSAKKSNPEKNVEVQAVKQEESATTNIEVGAQTIPFGMPYESLGKAVSGNIEQAAKPVDFDATLHYDSKGQNFPPIADSKPSVDSSPQQNNVKTEVLLASDLPLNDLKVPEISSASVTNEKDESSGSSATNENFTPDATFPVINLDIPNLDATQGVGNYDTSNKPENLSASASQFAVADFSNGSQSYSESKQNYDSQPVVPEPEIVPKVEPKKKSKGFLVGVLAGLFALLFLGAAGAGLGWYYYTGGFGTVATPTPTPEPTVAVTPTPEPTPDQSLVNANSDNTNTNTNEMPTESNTDNQNGIPTESPVITPEIKPEKTQVTQTPNTPTVKPTMSRQTPIIKTPLPTVKPTSKPILRGKDIPQ